MIEVPYLYFLSLILLIFFVWKLYRAGIFDTVKVSIVENPPFLNRQLTVYYKHLIGPYKNVGKTFKEAKELMPQGATLFGIYYDDPKVVKEHLLQSAIGVVFGEDGKDLYTPNYGEQLTRWGFERMALPVVDKAVMAVQKFDGILSLIALIKFTYSKMSTFIKKSDLHVKVSLEFYADGKIHVLFPLDHHQEFVVPQHLSLEALETKLARRKWDSDESESCSDTEPEEEGTEHSEIDAEVEGEDKKND